MPSVPIEASEMSIRSCNAVPPKVSLTNVCLSAQQQRLSSILATSEKLAIPRNEAEAKAAWLAWWPEMAGLLVLAGVRLYVLDKGFYAYVCARSDLNINWDKPRSSTWGPDQVLAQSMLLASIAPGWRRLPAWREQNLYSSPRRLWLFLESASEDYDGFAKGQGIIAAKEGEEEDGPSDVAEDFVRIDPAEFSSM